MLHGPPPRILIPEGLPHLQTWPDNGIFHSTWRMAGPSGKRYCTALTVSGAVGAKGPACSTLMAVLKCRSPAKRRARSLQAGSGSDATYRFGGWYPLPKAALQYQLNYTSRLPIPRSPNNQVVGFTRSQTRARAEGSMTPWVPKTRPGRRRIRFLCLQCATPHHILGS
jgi:hypothetical protein